MQHWHVMETVDCTFRDLRDSEKPFGGLTCVFGGDFQQILPVIIKGSRAQVVGACIQRSVLWRSITVLHLQQNMHLNIFNEAEADFAKWQLDVGQGKHTNDACNITLPDHFKCRENNVASLIDFIYFGVDTPNHPDLYFSKCTILSCKNNNVDSLNTAVLERFPGPIQVFHSADFIPDTEQGGQDAAAMLNYPIEYLNKISCSGLPLSKLELKAGCPVMILKNLDPSNGVCNGSCGILTRSSSRVLEVKLLTGQFAGHKVFIPRVYNQPTDEQSPFNFTRKQFPVRLCFSMTVSKSQGQTVKHVGLELRTPIFTHGQLYVAISRVTSVYNIKAICGKGEEHGEQARERDGKTSNIVYFEVLFK